MKAQFTISLFNAPPGKSDGRKYNVSVIRAEDGKDAEILIHGPIGRSFWSDDGITGKQFTDALNEFPKGTKVTVGVNSQGGSVGEGLAIYNAIERRADDITVRIDGYALSIASFFPLAASKVISPESALWMIHNVWSWMDGCQGNAEDMRKHAELVTKAADMLEKHDDVLVAKYAERTGKSEKEIRQALADETWLTGAEAVEWGLADEMTDASAALDALDFSGMEPKAFKKIPVTCRAMILAAAKGDSNNPGARTPEPAPPITAAADNSPVHQGAGKTKPPQENYMKDKIIALLKKRGISADANATLAMLIALAAAAGFKVSDKSTETEVDAILAAEPNPQPHQPSNVIDIQAEIKKGIDAATAAIQRKSDAKDALKALVDEKRITQAQANKALASVLAETGELKDSSLLAALRENPVMPEAAEPVAAETIITAEASVTDICNGIQQTHLVTKAWQRGGSIGMKALAAASVRRAQIITKHAEKLFSVLNAGTNTIDATLQRDVILQTVIVDFARRVMPLRAFSTVFSNVPLEGTNKVQVPFYDLDASASTSFTYANGYVAGDTATDNREIQIGKRAAADVADDTKTYDRKYQGLSVTSEELARQPFLNTVQLARLKAEKLASDIVAHVLGIITAANYGVAAVTKVAALFNSDDLAVVKLACKLWPDMGRSLILDSAYDAALLKDVAFKHALNAASDSAIKEGRLNPRVYGFDYQENPTIPGNGENLVGFAAFMSGILFAQAPVPPGEEVRNDGTTYSIVTDPKSGASFEYRTYGDSQADKGVHIIEASYGFAKGNGNAIKRITSA